VRIHPDYDPRIVADDLRSLAPFVRESAQKVAEMESQGKILGIDGRFYPTPGWLQTKQSEAAATAQGTAQGQAPYDLVDYQPDPGGPVYKVPKATALAMAANAGKTGGAPGVVASQPAVYAEAQKAVQERVNKETNDANQRQVIRNRFNIIQDVMKDYQSGIWSEEKANIQKALGEAGISLPDDWKSWKADKFETFIKEATGNVMEMLKAEGGQPRVAIMQAFGKSTTNPNMQPAANALIASQGQGILDWQDKYFHDLSSWYSNGMKNNKPEWNLAGFTDSWNRDPANNLDNFIAARSKAFGYTGQYIPSDPQKRENGQTYLTAKGPRVWRNGAWFQPNE
jgi:hypothetical protein